METFPLAVDDEACPCSDRSKLVPSFSQRGTRDQSCAEKKRKGSRACRKARLWVRASRHSTLPFSSPATRRRELPAFSGKCVLSLSLSLSLSLFLWRVENDFERRTLPCVKHSAVYNESRRKEEYLVKTCVHRQGE